MADEKIVYRFTGGTNRAGKPSRWHEGIPARDLTQRDVDRLEPGLLKTLKASPIYETAKPAAANANDKPAEKKA